MNDPGMDGPGLDDPGMEEQGDAASSSGRRVVVAGSGGPGVEIALLLAAAGARVVLVDTGEASAPPPVAGSTVTVVESTLGSPAAAEDAATATLSALGGVDQLVHAHVPVTLCRPAAFATVGEEQWARECEGTLDAAWWLVRALVPPIKADGGGSVVFVVPTVGLSGASRYVMLSTVAEGLRILAKSCGRCWGTSGVAVTTVAASPSLWVGQEEGARLHREISLSEPATGGPGTAADVAAVVGSLGAQTMRSYSAGTVVVDGGVWMGL